MNAIAAPAVSRATVLRRDEFVAHLHGLVPVGDVVHDEQGRHVYAGDAFGAYQALPLAVVLPATVREVSQVLRYCYEVGLKVFPRGAGTSLVGGAVAAEDGIVLCLSRMNNVLEVDPVNRMVRVEAGITNAAVSTAVAGLGLRFAPDPASWQASTIGGNIATNAGGARGMSVGATGRHVLALKIVLVDGEVIELGGGELEASGLDLIGLVVGAEGMLGVVVEATLRVVPEPETRRLVVLGFQSVLSAVACAGKILSSVIVPTALEVLDREVIAVCEDFGGIGLPRDVEAVLVVEVEGSAEEAEQLGAAVLQAADAYAPVGHLEISDQAQVARSWATFNAAFTGLGRLGTVRCVDIAVPPAKLVEAMTEIGSVATRYGLRGASMCRAAEGIVRSVLLYDGSNSEDIGRVADAMADVARMCAQIGGVLAGEHGVGVAKRDVMSYQLAESDLVFGMRLKSTFDTEWLLSNGKVYPLADQVVQSAVA